MESNSIPPPPMTTGALVRLKSGGPAMSIIAANSGGRRFVLCGWFWRGKYHEEEFYVRVLTTDLNEPIPPIEGEVSQDTKSA